MNIVEFSLDKSDRCFSLHGVPLVEAVRPLSSGRFFLSAALRLAPNSLSTRVRTFGYADSVMRFCTGSSKAVEKLVEVTHLVKKRGIL